MPELAPPPQPVVVDEKDGAPANVDGSEGSSPDDLASEDEGEEDGNGYSYGYADYEFSDLGAKPLFAAIWSGKPLSVLQAIVKRRPDSVMGNCTGESPLHHAVRQGLPLAHVKFLHDKHPAAIEGWYEGQRLPLHFISGKTPVEVVEFLVEKYPEALWLEGDSSDCPLPIHGGVANAGVGVVQVLVERYPDSLLEPDEDGNLPIHLAAIASENPHQLEVVKYLARQRPESLLWRTQPEIFKNGKVNDEVDDDDDGDLPIHLAAEQKGPQQMEVIEFLADACLTSLEMTAKGGSLPLHRALKSEVMPGVVKRLLDLTPIPVESKLALVHSAVRYAEERETRNREANHSHFDCTYLRDNVVALAEAHPESLRAMDSRDGSRSTWPSTLPLARTMTTRSASPLPAASLISIRNRCCCPTQMATFRFTSQFLGATIACPTHLLDIFWNAVLKRLEGQGATGVVQFTASSSGARLTWYGSWFGTRRKH
jgi:ankyrin repeat protein